MACVNLHKIGITINNAIVSVYTQFEVFLRVQASIIIKNTCQNRTEEDKFGLLKTRWTWGIRRSPPNLLVFNRRSIKFGR